MAEEQLKEFIRNAKEEYKKIGSVECPAFRGKKVYFNKDGFNHLIRKKGKIRRASEQVQRLRLFHYGPIILKEAYYAQSKKLDIHNGYPAYFWVFTKTIKLRLVRVIVRQLGKGRKHFFSIY